MKSTIPVQLGANHSDMLRTRVRAITQVRTHGTQKTPAPVRGVVVQPGQGGALLTWHLPSRYDDVTGYRVYVGTERNLSIQIRDRGTRQVFVPLSNGDGVTPPKNNIFVSAVNGFREGGKIQIQTAATPASPTTSVPQPTDDYLHQFSGGVDKTQSGQPSGRKVP